MIIYTARTQSDAVVVYAHDSEHGSASISISLCAAGPNFLRSSMDLSITEVREAARALLAAADAVEQSLSSAPPETTAASLPADGGAFSSEGA